ncbi:MAG: lytic transglycosylase domain-containing protein [Acidimicrobiales bacterium]
MPARVWATLPALAGLVLGGCRDSSPARTSGTKPTATVTITVPAVSTSITTPAVAPTAVPSTALASPAEVAASLVSVEGAIREPSTPPADIVALGRAQQVAYRVLIARPEWQAEVVARVPPALNATVAANADAGRELSLLTGVVPANRPRPRWLIVAPEPASVLVALYKEAAASVGIAWQELAAIHLVETRMGRIRGDSIAGAQGPMQFIPSTWRIYGAGGDIRSTRDSVFAAARMLRARGAPGDVGRALFAYNPSPRYVRAVSAYATEIRSNERAYLGYHAWQVYYRDQLLPEGTDWT